MARSLRIFITLLFLLFSSVALSDQVNINTADAETLASMLKGVGPVKAQAIVDYREKHGSFMSINALYNVKGVGEMIVEENKENMTIGEESE